MNKPSFVISSPYDTYSGYGARARDIIKSIIQTEKYDVKLLTQKWGSTSWGFCADHKEWKFLLDHQIPNNQLTQKPDIWMQITIPNEFQPVGKYNIGCTAGIEATVCKGEWIEGMNRMDINWVSSNFSKYAFENTIYEKRDNKTQQSLGQLKLEKPIEVVFEGANLETYLPLKSIDVKFNLSSIKENFAYLFVGHWMQSEFGHDRKNVSLLVKAFYETFKNKKNPPALILKTSVGVASYMSRDEILKRINHIKKSVNSTNLPNIYVLNGEFTDKEMNELYNHPKIKAMVSLTKGEGFGRPLLEFSLSNKPILATDFSGHKDFLNPEFTTLLPGELEKVHKSAANEWLIQEAEWFKPSYSHIGHYLKDIFENYKEYQIKGKRQGYYSRTNFSYEKMAELVKDLLDKNIPEFPKQVELTLPKLNLPKLSRIE
jgi:glycosyltransferase involved in cell wall biosynthesis